MPFGSIFNGGSVLGSDESKSDIPLAPPLESVSPAAPVAPTSSASSKSSIFSMIPDNVKKIAVYVIGLFLAIMIIVSTGLDNMIIDTWNSVTGRFDIRKLWGDGMTDAEKLKAAGETAELRAADGAIVPGSSEASVFSGVGKAKAMKSQYEKLSEMVLENDSVTHGIDTDELVLGQLTTEADRASHRHYAKGARPFTGGASNYIQIEDRRDPGLYLGMRRPRHVAATDPSSSSSVVFDSTRDHYNSVTYSSPMVFGTNAGVYDQFAKSTEQQQSQL